jgi:hypothetical protein
MKNYYSVSLFGDTGSSTWQNNPTNNISLNVYLYEAGKGWWQSGSGLNGVVSVKKVEYQGSDGEWLWPPVDSGYNVSKISSVNLNSGSGTITLGVNNTNTGTWRTGNYRVILQATTSSGATDYGYAWFSVKLWDVYGSPVECTSSGCNYKSYFNSRENISLYIKISKAGDYSSQSGQDIYGNVTVGIKKIQDCRGWPCKDLNSSQYSSTSINVNSSSPWYWNSNSQNFSNYVISIIPTSGTWGSGYYSVVLNVNRTDTGYAWFNTIAFYVDVSPTDINGTSYKYSIRGNRPMYFNVSSVKSYKTGYWYNDNGTSVYVKYNQSDYINTTVQELILRVWDQQNWKTKEYNYPINLNVTPLSMNGNVLLNLTYLNGSWPTGYYWGELRLKNSDNETSTGWLWFNVQPFRVSVSSNSYNFDNDQCVNATLSIYDADWSSSQILTGNYSIISVTENIYSGYSSSTVTYTNYTNTSFNGTGNFLFCPNNGIWGSGSWGGYHYLNILVRDNTENDSQTGWISFRTVPFQVSWGSVGSTVLAINPITVSVSLTKPSTGANTTGNLTKIYQWRYDNYQSTREEYVFRVGSCYSNISGQCSVNGTQSVVIYPPSGGWKNGYNYLYAEWTKTDDSSVSVSDWSGIYFDSRSYYSGYFSNSDSNGNYKYDFRENENLTIKLTLQDINNNLVDATISNVYYADSNDNCWSESCRSYSSASFSPTTTTSGTAILNIRVPSTNWTRGNYYIKATVSGVGGSATVTGGNLRVKDFIGPNVSISSPVINSTYNKTFSFSATTTESSSCNLYFINYDNFYNWYCTSLNSSNSSNSSIPPGLLNSCNRTYYNLNGSSYYNEYLSSNYRSTYNGSLSNWWSGTFLTTGGASHSYSVNASEWFNQDYGLQVYCYDSDYNSGYAYAAFRINNTL